MIYKQIYYTPNDFDNMLMTSNGKVLTGLCFIDSHEQTHQQIDCESKNLAIFKDTCHWLDIYFTGKQPNFMPTYEVENMTLFRKEVFDIMLSIPFGKVMTYGDIATKIAISHGIKKMSARAVGGAVGWNPLCIIIPCHRVIGANKKLTGYGGGMKNKIALLALEGNDLSQFSIPKEKI